MTTLTIKTLPAFDRTQRQSHLTAIASDLGNDNFGRVERAVAYENGKIVIGWFVFDENVLYKTEITKAATRSSMMFVNETQSGEITFKMISAKELQLLLTLND